MKIKRKKHRYRIKKIIKAKGILHTLRCTVIQFKTELQYTFFVECRILRPFVI